MDEDEILAQALAAARDEQQARADRYAYLQEVQRKRALLGTSVMELCDKRTFSSTTCTSTISAESFPDLPSGLPATILHDVLTREECVELIKSIPFREGEPGYMSESEVSSAYINRIVERYTSYDPLLSSLVSSRIQLFIPQEILEEKSNVCTLAGLSPEWRFLHYRKGGHQGYHVDGREHRADAKSNVYSRMTIQMYLNDCDIDYHGGTLRFFSPDLNTVVLDFRPRAGDCLLFYQEDTDDDEASFYLGHEAAEVTSGDKYALRCMVEYEVVTRKSSGT